MIYVRQEEASMEVHTPRSVKSRFKSGCFCILIMVDRTVYTDADHTPELPLRQIFGQLKLNQDLCKLAADTGLLTVGHFAIASVKDTVKNMMPDHSKFGSDAPAQELALTSYAAVWKTCSTMHCQSQG